MSRFEYTSTSQKVRYRQEPNQLPPWIERVVQKIEPAGGLDEIGLPEQLIASLKRVSERLAAVSTGSKAHADVTVLFEGESVSKMKAGAAIARAHNLELYRIDLSLAVSIDTQETERTLRRILDAAEQAGGVLFFDDGDALFPAGTPEDRYPERGGSYLTKQMSRYEGLTILSLGSAAAVDPAVKRRFRFSVDFAL
ncbi:MAG: AAA family ATPase [Actinomycetota bacterium]